MASPSVPSQKPSKLTVTALATAASWREDSTQGQLDGYGSEARWSLKGPLRKTRELVRDFCTHQEDTVHSSPSA